MMLFWNLCFVGKLCCSTAFIGKVRFTISDLARNKVIDDSNIIFKTGTEENFGRIRRIFKVNDGDPVFYVDVVSIMSDFQLSASGTVYEYSNIRTGSYTEGTNSVFISGEHIVEKCVFYERANKLCTFFRFPNLQESSWTFSWRCLPPERGFSINMRTWSSIPLR
jgi:hypothetical protein